ncbi:MAG: EAL domain-containing protein [Halomonas sp.]|nr:EAL domain-containing protein [Halomonas sp.]MBR2515075.1 EAL domain-containing protein [Halomonas sp.]
MVGLLVLFTWALSDQYRQEVNSSRERSATRAELVAEWVNSTFVLSNQVLVDVAQLVELPVAPVVAELHDFDFEELLRKRRDSLAMIHEIEVIDHQWQRLASSSASQPLGLEPSAKEFLEKFEQEPWREQLVTPLSWSAAFNDYHILHARRVQGAESRFNGLALLCVEPLVFNQALDRLSMGPGESIAIIDTEGQLVARRPGLGPQTVLGTPINHARITQFLTGNTPSDSVQMVSPLEGDERLFWLHRVEGLPFAVVVGESMQQVLAGWWQRLWILSAIWVLIGLLGGWGLRHYLNRLQLEMQLYQRMQERELARAEAQQREARLQALVYSIQDMIFVFDGQGCMSYVHAIHQHRLLKDVHNITGKHYSDVLPEEVAKAFSSVFYRVRRHRHAEELEYSLTFEGEVRYFTATISPLSDASGGFDGVLALVRDITQAKMDDVQLRIAATAFQTHLGMLITDAQGCILKVNRTFTRITGYQESDVLGENPRMFSSGRHDADFYRTLWGNVAKSGNWEGEVWNRRKNGEVFPEWLTISAVKDNDGVLTHYVATLSDITERKAAEKEIHKLAFYDPLTGLANRRLFMDRLEATMKTRPRNPHHGALLFIDLDNFKQVNDTLGHYAGDQLLQQMATQLQAVLRETDTLARLGGDEFAVVIDTLNEDAEQTALLAEGIAQKLLVAIRRPVLLRDETVMVTGSIGITVVDGSAPSVDDYLQQADMALFQAKEAGRDTLSFFDPAMQSELVQRARLEADLRHALANQQWRLHYQPQVDGDGVPTGVEALLRWQHPERGMVSPGVFISLLESTRLINEVGDWVLEEACCQLAEWAQQPQYAHLEMAVNVSPLQFREPDFLARTQAILQRTGAPLEKLKLEVTESLFVEARDDARAKMEALRALGVRFSLDDFGTGYSSLAYLAKLPLDQLKIDQSFVREILQSPANAAIVESTIALAKSLGLEVIAEGVETGEQQRWLAEHGCYCYQGYLFARPMALSGLTQWVSQQEG